MLYERASQLKDVDKLLLVKNTSDEVERLIRRIAAWGKELKDELESLTSGYPAIDLRDNGLPEVEKRTRESMADERRKQFLPLVGESGGEFERLLLLDQLSALDQQRHMAATMTELETSSERKAFLDKVRRRYEALFDDAQKLVRQRCR